ncbi:MAG: sulfatase [Akkermansiaceae bacterium]|nr:sulfatase [Akkermansiaceae bacterium]
MNRPGALLLLLLLVPGPWQRAAADERPNILLILTDDHRWDALGCKGHPYLKTPHLDRLAAEGVDFENAFVTTSLCSPSRASIITGLYAHNHGVVDNYHAVRDDLVFFPELLQKAGYDTAFVGKWHMGDTDEKQRGFEHWVSFKGQGVYWPFDEGLKVKGRYVPQANRTGFNVNGERVAQKGYITDEITDYALEWLKKRPDAGGAGEGRQPWFLYVSHKAVHADFLPPNRHAYKFEDEAFERPVTWAEKPELFRDVPQWVRNQRNSRHGVEFAYYMDLDHENYYKRYCETLLAVDESVGRLLAAVEAGGEAGNTLVLYLGDNGFLFGEHGLIDKRCAYEESMRIPMLARWPEGIAAGTKVEALVANIDVAPTLLSAAGISTPEFMDGANLLPLTAGQDSPWREEILYEYYWERNYPQTPTMHALRGPRYKYVRYHGVWDVNELYDLQEDPRERRNLINDAAHAERVQAMNERLFASLAATDGLAIPLLEDRGTRFYHRKEGGTREAPFPDWFYRAPGTDGK